MNISEQSFDAGSAASSLDTLFQLIAIIAGAVLAITVFFLFSVIMQIIKKERTFEGKGLKTVVSFSMSLLSMGMLFVGIYLLPNIFNFGISWLDVFGSLSISIVAMAVLSAAIVVFYVYVMLITYFEKEDDKPYFLLIFLSIINGLAYASMMFFINMVLSDFNLIKSGVGFYYVICVLFYVLGTKKVRYQLAIVTNNMVFNKRVELISRMIKTPYYRIENLGKEKIYSCLSFDCEMVSHTVGFIATGATCGVSMLCCFIYLGILNIYGLLSAVVFVIVGAGITVIINRNANNFFERSRDMQDSFVSFIDDLVNGFKELSINTKKGQEFRADINENCRQHNIFQRSAELISANETVSGEIVALIILGGLAFIFPLVFTDVQGVTLSEFVFLFLYLKGPYDGVINLIPQLTRLRVSLKRINSLNEEIASLEYKAGKQDKSVTGGEITLALNNVKYEYKNDEEEHFSIGPVNCEFRSGKITFITGGNGSGKSTLAKIITGLYLPDEGEIIVNGENIEWIAANNYISAVYSDYYLFKKLYGIEREGKDEVINEYLETLRIKDKLSIDSDGNMSTIKLSSGQRKRLALLVSYLEDRPIYVFDEWAADQDPEFRKFFYHTLLPEMKARGKCVIAITHDDRFFDIADDIIKMEMGKIV